MTMCEALMTPTSLALDRLLSPAAPAAMQIRPRVDSATPILTTVDEPLLFSGRSRREDLVRSYPELEPVCDLLGLGWERTLIEHAPAPAGTLLTLARAAQPPPLARHSDWSSSLVSELVDDLRTMHHRPLIHELERLGLLMDHVLEVHTERILKTADRGFRRLRQNVHRNIRHEEITVFPLCLDLEEALHGHTRWSALDVTSAIRRMAEGHATITHGLTHCIALSQAAFAACPDPDLGLVLSGLEAMKADLAVHAYGELEILLPAAIAAEEQLKARSR
jgi:iron-sulfur cluster repair protein YtfE (RIC family)